MASVNSLLVEALEAFGAPGSPEPDPTSELGVRIRRQLLRTLRFRIPQFVPGLTRDGVVSKTIVPSATPAEDTFGIYAWPTNLASATKPFILTAADGEEIRPQWHANPDEFWKCHERGDLAPGTPSDVLVRARQWQLRPLPQPTSGPYLITCYGTLYPDAPETDSADVIAEDLVDAVVSGAVVFAAMREGDEEIVGRFMPQWEAALKQLAGIDLATYRPPVVGSDF